LRNGVVVKQTAALGLDAGEIQRKVWDYIHRIKRPAVLVATATFYSNAVTSGHRGHSVLEEFNLAALRGIHLPSSHVQGGETASKMPSMETVIYRSKSNASGHPETSTAIPHKNRPDQCALFWTLLRVANLLLSKQLD
jgi:hypothetical protein